MFKVKKNDKKYCIRTFINLQDWPGGNGSFSISSVTGSGSGLHRDLSQQSTNILNIMSDKHSHDKRSADKTSKSNNLKNKLTTA